MFDLKQIKIDIDNAKATLNALEALAAEVREKKKAAVKLGQELNNCWQGNSGTALQEKMNKWGAEQEAIAAAIEEQVSKIRGQLQKVIDTDKALANYISKS